MMRLDFSLLQILVVEDNMYMRRLIAGMLEAVGINDIILNNGINDARLTLRVHAPDIIILDHLMRDGYGIDLLRELRATEDRVRAEIPVIMLTAHGDTTTVEEAREAGATSFLVKPVSAERLIRRLAWVIDPSAGSEGCAIHD